MNLRIVAAVVIAAFFQDTVITLARITTSYRALELGVSPLIFGLINAAYAVVPIFLAIVVGRFIDRGNEITVSRLSAVLIVAACAGFLWLPTATGLMIFTALLGISFLALTVALQVVCARISSPADFPRMIGSYLVANAIGQAFGALIVAKIGGDAKLPSTQPLYLAAFVLALLIFVSSLFLLSRRKAESEKVSQPHVSLAELFRIPRFKLLLSISVTCTAASDLILIYFPVLGAERGLSVELVGVLLTIRSVATIAARVAFTRLYAMVGAYRLMVGSAAASAVSCFLLMIVLPEWTLYIVMAVLGFALSVCQTVTMTSFIDLASDHIWGTVTSVRMIGNRVGQFAFPVLASMIAALSSIATIFAFVGLGLALSAAAAEVRRPR